MTVLVEKPIFENSVMLNTVTKRNFISFTVEKHIFENSNIFRTWRKLAQIASLQSINTSRVRKYKIGI